MQGEAGDVCLKPLPGMMPGSQYAGPERWYPRWYQEEGGEADGSLPVPETAMSNV